MAIPLSEVDRASVIQQAQAIATQQGISPEMALWNYAQTNGISASDLDTYMSWPSGTTSTWVTQNSQPTQAPTAPVYEPAPATPEPLPVTAPVSEPTPTVLTTQESVPAAPAFTPGPEAPVVLPNPSPVPTTPTVSETQMVTPLSEADRASIIQQAQAISLQEGVSPELALWNYAQSNGISASDLDTYMGFPSGTSQGWAVQTGQIPAPLGNFTPSSTPLAPMHDSVIEDTVVKRFDNGGQDFYAPVPEVAGVEQSYGLSPPSATTTSSPSPLSPEVRASIIEQANTIAQQQGITPEQALYNYAQANGISAPQVDTYMGWPTGTTQSWVTQTGQAPAPQGNYTFNITNQIPTATQQTAVTPPKAPVTPLDDATRASIIQQAQTIAGQQNITPEQALYNYAQTQGIPNSDVDTYMSWPTGTTSAWVTKANAPAPVKSAIDLAKSVAPAGVYGLDPATRASIIQQATDIGRLQGISPEQALYNYAQTQHLGNTDVDTYMGFQPGATAAWAATHLPGTQAATPPAGPLTTVPQPTTPAATQPAAPYQPQYKVPAFNALYNNQQQRMNTPAPQFNFQSQQPEQPGALTNVISGT